ncbi:DUF503 family protein [Candidatus Fermentibacteria bacterium]|nr:DUF503 family protein [Candidatus Fermentibacteria bacterium]
MSGRRRPRSFVGVLQAELLFPGCRTLKDRRGHLRSLLDRLRRMGFSSSQVGDSGIASRAWISAVCACSSMSAASRLLQSACAILDSPEWELVRSSDTVTVFEQEE